MEDVRLVVGQNTRRLRLAASMTQEELSERSGITQQYISGLERGYRNPTVITLAQIAYVLECQVFQLLMVGTSKSLVTAEHDGSTARAGLSRQKT